MNATQLNQAMAISINEALKSAAAGQIGVEQIIGVIEMHKCAVLNHIAESQKRETIIPIHRLPKNAE